MSWEPWDEAIDELVGEMMKTLALDQPPVDVMFIVRAVGCELAFDAGQYGRARQKTREGLTAVFLRPDDRHERLQWAAAHELGEIMAWQICKRVGEEVDELSMQFREELANRFAPRLLLPTVWFSAQLHEIGSDLFLFKERFSTASHELIARRLLDYFPGRILTIVDQEQVVYRQNGYHSRPGPLLSAERELIQSCHTGGEVVCSETDGICCEVWPVHEPHWKREIAFTYASESGERHYDTVRAVTAQRSS